MCARTANAKRIVEFGTSFGISSIYLAAELRDNGGGELICTEIEESKALQARKNIAAAGLSDLVDIRIGDALETLSTGFKGKIDLAHLDGAFSLYLPVLKLLEPHFRMGTVLISENRFGTEYLKHIRNPANGYHSKRILVGEGKENQGRGNELTIVTWNKMSPENRLHKTSASMSDVQSVAAMEKCSSQQSLKTPSRRNFHSVCNRENFSHEEPNAFKKVNNSTSQTTSAQTKRFNLTAFNMDRARNFVKSSNNFCNKAHFSHEELGSFKKMDSQTTSTQIKRFSSSLMAFNMNRSKTFASSFPEKFARNDAILMRAMNAMKMLPK
jgi:hypothetical protein